jgi:HSP20 family molecular chaperone IbpA
MHSIYTSENKNLLCLELPGLHAGDVEIGVQDRELTVRTSPSWEAEGRQVLSELPRTEGILRFKLDRNIDPESIEAVLGDGILLLTLHKRTLHRKIAISAA